MMIRPINLHIGGRERRRSPATGLFQARTSSASPDRQLTWELRLAEALPGEWGRHTLDRRVFGANNRVEQAIGRLRRRVRGTRGVKTWAGLEAALLLSHLGVA